MNKKEYKNLFSIFIGWRVLLFLLPVLILSLIQSITNPSILEYTPSFPYAESILQPSNLPQWLYSWGNFDGVHYITIATKGYFGTGLIQAFFPLYPMILKLFNLVLPNIVLISIIISTFFSWLSIVLFYKLVKNDYPKYALLSTIILLFFPTSFFLGATYNESLFLSLIFGSFIFARKKHWFWAGLLAALASATRIVGVFLVPALIIELWLQYGKSLDLKNISLFVKNNTKKIFFILVGTTGLLFYMIYLHKVFADPLYFLHVQSEFGAGRQESLILFPQVIWRYIKILMTSRPFDFKYYTYIQDFIFSLGGLAILLIGFTKKYKIRASYLVFSLLALILPTLTGTFSSMPRYVLVCFPIFIYFAMMLKNRKKLLVSYLTISAILLILNTILFLQGYWVA